MDPPVDMRGELRFRWGGHSAIHAGEAGTAENGGCAVGPAATTFAARASSGRFCTRQPRGESGQPIRFRRQSCGGLVLYGYGLSDLQPVFSRVRKTAAGVCRSGSTGHRPQLQRRNDAIQTGQAPTRIQIVDSCTRRSRPTGGRPTWGSTDSRSVLIGPSTRRPLPRPRGRSIRLHVQERNSAPPRSSSGRRRT